jgi:hypothetical protein
VTEEPEGLCAAPQCPNPLPERSGRGRPAMYCSPTCRPTATKHQLRRIDVEVGHEPTDDGERPSGRVWSVTLRRGSRSVMVAAELGRPSAENLASQLNDLLAPQTRIKGGAID